MAVSRQWPANADYNLYVVPNASMTAAFNAEKKRIFLDDKGDEDSEKISVIHVEPNVPVRKVSLQNTEAAVVAYLKQQPATPSPLLPTPPPTPPQEEPKGVSTTVILIRQSFSWGELDITAPAAQALLTHFCISPGFWHVVKKFGSKTSNDQDLGGGFNELVLPATATLDGFFELSYTAKHVEQHCRPERCNYDPWSIRQIGVGHRYDPASNANTVVVVNPSKALVQRINEVGADTHMLDIHRLVLGAVTERWGEYLVYLESVCKEIVSVYSPIYALLLTRC
jgi:hypothetical protein